MARSEPQQILRPSLLDRLSGEERGGASHALGPIGVRELKRAVQRDLEWLLNTRVFLPFELEGLEEARASILAYGLPDLSVYSWTNPADTRRVAARIRDAVRGFEPRLLPRSVAVTVQPRRDAADFSLRFRIEGVLHVDPVDEPVAFDTTVDAAGGVSVEERL